MGKLTEITVIRQVVTSWRETFLTDKSGADLDNVVADLRDELKGDPIKQLTEDGGTHQLICSAHIDGDAAQEMCAITVEDA